MTLSAAVAVLSRGRLQLAFCSRMLLEGGGGGVGGGGGGGGVGGGCSERNSNLQR
jgi:hypothetical protein